MDVLYHVTMTLIISALTEQYVALVSDRRITWTDGRMQEDTDTKTFNLFGQFLMGFTGLARIDGFRIERWVSQILSGVPTEEYFSVLAREIDAAFLRLGYCGKIPHAFLAVGYAALKPNGQIYPMNIVISNSIGNDGNFSLSALSPEFGVYVEPLFNRRQVIRSVGWPMREATNRALAHRMRIVSKGDAANPALSVGPLVMALRDTARVSKEHVGSAVLFASLPRCAVPSPGIAMGQIDFRRQAAALFLPDTARSASEATIYAPACINPQLHTLGFKLYAGHAAAASGRRGRLLEPPHPSRSRAEMRNTRSLVLASLMRQRASSVSSTD